MLNHLARASATVAAIATIPMFSIVPFFVQFVCVISVVSFWFHMYISSTYVCLCVWVGVRLSICLNTFIYISYQRTFFYATNMMDIYFWTYNRHTMHLVYPMCSRLLIHVRTHFARSLPLELGRVGRVCSSLLSFSKFPHLIIPEAIETIWMMEFSVLFATPNKFGFWWTIK